MKHIILPALLCLAFASCSYKETTINAPAGDWQLFTASADMPYQISLLNQPGNSVASSNIYSDAKHGRVSKLLSFRDMLYIFVPDEHRIEVRAINDGYKHVATLDFTAGQHTPSDIAFPNATTGYITLSDTSLVGIMDITRLPTDTTSAIVVRYISVGKHPSAIVAAGNQLLTANTGDNTVSIIDTRDNEVKGTIPVHTAPMYIQVSPDAETAIVVSAGAGKFDSDTKSGCRAGFIDIAARQLIKETTLYETVTDSLNQIPYGLAVTKKEFAFIPLSHALIRLDIQSKTALRVIEKQSYHRLLYNAIRDEVVAVDTVGGKAANYSAIGGKDQSFTLPFRPSAVLTK